jgi:DNA primase
MFDALRFFRDYGINYFDSGNNVSPGWINISCVFHPDSNHLGYSPEGKFYCWKCGGHHVETVISRLLVCSSREAKRIVSDYEAANRSRRVLNKKENSAKITNKKINLPGEELSKYHRRYLKKRNFSPRHLIDKYGIVGTGPSELWRKRDFQLRVIIPIIEDGKLISFQGRDITDKQKLRYKGCPIEESRKHYKHTLYNIDNCPGSTIRLVEGITDVWRMGDGYAATFGTTMTDYQIKLLTRYEHIYFIFDPEAEAQQKATRAAEKLASFGKRVERVVLDKKCDPGDLSEKEADELRNLLI